PTHPIIPTRHSSDLYLSSFFLQDTFAQKPEFILARGTTLGLATSHPHFSGSYCRLLCLFRGVKRAVGIVSFTLFADAGADVNCRSEEHTSELQSLRS